MEKSYDRITKSYKNYASNFITYSKYNIKTIQRTAFKIVLYFSSNHFVATNSCLVDFEINLGLKKKNKYIS